MLVKAKWNVKDANGWHDAGQVFMTNEDLGEAVEVLDAPKAPEPKADPVKVPAKASGTVKAEPEKEAPRPRSTSRRKVSK